MAFHVPQCGLWQLHEYAPGEWGFYCFPLSSALSTGVENHCSPVCNWNNVHRAKPFAKRGATASRDHSTILISTFTVGFVFPGWISFFPNPIIHPALRCTCCCNLITIIRNRIISPRNIPRSISKNCVTSSSGRSFYPNAAETSILFYLHAREV